MTAHAIVGATLADGSPVDVVIDGERIEAVGPGAGAGLPGRVEARAGLLLPAYVDTHVHLDKVLVRDQLAEHDGTLQA
ncbi:MAG: hypothetical protein ACRDV2_13635, partial [Actinomycetes bacterium]